MEQTNQLISTVEAAKFLGSEIPRYQSELSSQADDAPRHPLLQTKRQTVLLRQGRPGGMDEEHPRGIAGGTQPAGPEVYHQPS